MNVDNVDKQTSFVSMMEKFGAEIISHIRSKVPIDEVDDILNSVRLAAWSSWDALSHTEKPLGYLRAIAKNCIADYYREQRRWKRVVEAASHEFKVYDTPQEKEPGPSLPFPQIVSASEYALMGGIARGLTNDEMAGLLHLSKNTIRSHMKGLYKKLSMKNRYRLILFCKEFVDGFGERSILVSGMPKSANVTK